MKWISLKDEYPADLDDVLVYLPEEDGRIVIAFWDEYVCEWEERDTQNELETEPTHWMPLPEQPE